MFDFSCDHNEFVSNSPDRDSHSLKSKAHEIEFTCQVGEDAFPFLADHRVYDVAIMPATAFVEMLFAVAKIALPSQIWSIEDFVIQKGLFFTPNEPKSVHLTLNMETISDVPFQIFSAVEDGTAEPAKIVHVSGRLLSGQPPSSSTSIDLIKKSQALKQVSVDEYYQTCRERGVDYGPLFQVVDQLWQTDREALGKIQLPSSLQTDKCYIHPVLLDSCLQVLWAALPAAETGKTYLPVGIERLKVHSPPSAHVWSHARIRHDEVAHALVADLCLLDQQGQILVELEGVLIESVTPRALLPQSQKTLAIAATFTADPIEDSLHVWMQELDLPYQSKFAPYNQVFQTLLAPDSLLNQNQDGANVILVRLEDWDDSKPRLPLQLDAAEQAQILENQDCYRLPNQLEITHLNQYETEYLYQELFIDQVYLKHGIVLKDGDCVIDVGANIGLFTLFAQQQCPNGSIYAFEPAPHAFDKLERNAALYCNNAKLFKCGLSSDHRSETFTYYPNSSVFSSFSADTQADEQAIRAVICNMLQRDGALTEKEIDALLEEFLSGRLERETYQVELRTLSSVIEEHNIEQIDLLKLDAEKSELPVLQGIKDEHWPRIQQMVVEVHDQVGNVIAEVKRLIQSKGFDLVIDEEDLLQSSGLYNIYATRSSRVSTPPAAEQTDLERNVQDFCAALKRATACTSTPHIVCLCPASPAALVDLKRQVQYQRMESLLAVELEQIKGVYLIDSTQVITTYTVPDYDNPHGHEFGHVPYNSTFFAALGTAVARKLHGIQRHPYKVIVLDCDNTLWQGVCGEVGPKEIGLEAPYRALQSFMVSQYDAGMLLCLCSKNNSSDVWDVFDQRSDMTLKADHIVRSRINWQPKSENLKSLAAELQLGLDSFIFIDDNPVECAEVQSNCPEVLTLQLPADPSQILQFLHHVWAFDHLDTTAEDQQRTTLYQQNIQREQFRQETLTFGDFLAGLNVQVAIAPFTATQLPRISQLTQRTNQFNFTTIRCLESEIQHLCTVGHHECLGVHVSDRFGDYGTVGTILFKATATTLTVHTFLLSCRSLGRGVEYQMLAHLGVIAQTKGLTHVQITYVPTPKNQPALDFLDAVGSAFKQKTENGWQFNLPADLSAQLTYAPGEPSPETAETKSDAVSTVQPSQSGQLLTHTFNRIATELFEPQQVLAMIAHSRQRERPQMDTALVAPTNTIESELVTIWADILGLPQVGIHDNFFELGGRSLLMVQVHSRLRDRFSDSNLSPVELFQYPTIHSLAQRLQTQTEPAITDGSDRAERKRSARDRRKQQRTARKTQ